MPRFLYFSFLNKLVFSIFYVLPADPARLACGKSCTPELMERIRKAMEIDQPLATQYGRFVKGVFVGRTYNAGTEVQLECGAPCLGYSYQTDLPVTSLIKDRLPATLSIAVGASVLWLLVGLSGGVLSALKRGTLIDRGSQAFALAGGMIEVMSEDYIRTARAKGLSARRINFKHVLRSAITPIVTVFGLDLGALLGGAVITEYVFNIPGLGKLATEAVANVDMPVITGTVLLAAIFIITANMIVDIIYSFLDPKVRLK